MKNVLLLREIWFHLKHITCLLDHEYLKFKWIFLVWYVPPQKNINISVQCLLLQN